MISLVGNKTDLAEGERQVRREEGETYAAEANLIFTEASARTGENVSDAFVKIAERLPRTDQHLASPRLGTDNRRIDLGQGGLGSGTFSSRASRCC